MVKLRLKLSFLIFCDVIALLHITVRSHTHRQVSVCLEGVYLLASDTRVCLSVEADAIYESGMKV